MKYVLAIFSKDWADEFSAEGMCLFTENEWKRYKEEVKKIPATSFFFGTNEGWDDIPGAELLESIETRKMTEDEFWTMYKMFGKQNVFGIFPELDFISTEEED